MPSVNREPVIHHSRGEMFTIKKHDFKLILSIESGGRLKPQGEFLCKPYQLYKFKFFSSEQFNVAPDTHKIAAQLSF